ncbi:MAG: deoxyribodipyrimidine photo-lyase [Pseudomonadota bacterium]
MPNPKVSRPVIVWFRQDLRLADNPALSAAIATGKPVIAAYILDDANAGEWTMGGASRWWLHHSLAALGESLAACGVRLTLREGDPERILRDLIDKTGADTVVWNRLYEPWARERDGALKTCLSEMGIQARSYNGALLREPWTVESKSGGPYKVFTPYWRAASDKDADFELLDPPASITTYVGELTSDSLDDWKLNPSDPDWAAGFGEVWSPGEAGAADRLAVFVKGGIRGYSERRDIPGEPGTSRLSPHLHYGEVSPRQVWMALKNACAEGVDADKFRAELGWREFAHHLLHYFPSLPEENFQEKFDRFPWRDDEAGFQAWTRGRTGIPIVDAGMRELWATGWMHNRVRMIAGSFLVKNLLISWRRGETWFWDTLVDADLANNAAGWQWIGGSGADAAPYFRIFNPVSQGERFDPDGRYVRHWCPELDALPNALIHKPWTASRLELEYAGIRLGETYPEPIVDLGETRKRALAAFAQTKDAA